MLSLKNKNILITGALGSLGCAQVSTLSNAGETIFVVDIQSGEDEAATYIKCDLNNLEAAHDQIAALSSEIDGFDILVNNAAIIENKPLEEVSIEEYETILRVNTHAAFALTKAVLPEMKKKQAGRIINMCSFTMNGEWSGFAPYVASKGELLGLTRSLARELGPHNITVNAVSPGAIPSDAEQRVFGDKWQEYNDWVIERQSLKFRGEAEDISNIILFLTSNTGKFITGQNIHVNGGWLMEG